MPSHWGDHVGVKTCMIRSRERFVVFFFIFSPMAQSCKRKTKASGSIGSDRDICSPEGKKACNSPPSEPNISTVFSEDD